MLRTIADILKMEPMGLQVALADPMTEVFDRQQREWTYTAIVPDILRQTQLPLPARSAANSVPATEARAASQRRGATPSTGRRRWQDRTSSARIISTRRASIERYGPA